MTQGLKPGTPVKVTSFEATYVDASHYAYRVEFEGGYFNVPKYLVEEIFQAEDGAIYQDGDGDVFVYQEYDNLFVLAVCNGRHNRDGDGFTYKDLVPPITKLGSTQR